MAGAGAYIVWMHEDECNHRLLGTGKLRGRVKLTPPTPPRYRAAQA
eukprot:CAMPEP_0119391476 /NCGR_PEP_ID=MMETSP1334-20130426/117252_1 /TAXON_ID=127549 /ORGANISM="Calcidiscus leptoporus, Strain RCC1130" /LENGTH=45 /DNA_ID= /DNA_START= /DNA_END= /DNA_ORIENTATION=